MKIYLQEGIQVYDTDGNLYIIEDGDYTIINDRIMNGPILNTNILKSIQYDDQLDIILDLIENYGESFIINQLITGMNIELEHSEDTQFALQIAVDHICEIPDYYSRLIAMENEAK